MQGRTSGSKRSVGIAAAAAVSLCGAVMLTSSVTRARERPAVWNMNGVGRILGRTAAEWTAEWWQMVHGTPVSVNPALDDTGEFAAIGQRGPVWFLTGDFRTTSVNRTVTIPSGVSLLVPVLNVEWDNQGLAQPLTFTELQQLCADFVASIDPESLFFELDGTELADESIARVVAGEFTFAFPADSLGRFLGFDGSRGIYGPAAADGYWVMLRPLAPGRHTLRFGGSAGAPFNFAIDINYTVDVVETSLR